MASHLQDNESLIAATHVCHFWRWALISSPRLWSNLILGDESRAQVFLERSKFVPVSVEIRGKRRLPKTVREILKEIAERLTALRAEHISSLDELFIKPLPMLRNLDITTSGFPSSNASRTLFHVHNLTSFVFTLRSSGFVAPRLGDSLLKFLQSCPLLEVAFFDYCDLEQDIESTIGEASTKAVSLPHLRSFTHESPLEMIPVGLFNRLSLQPTCNLAFTIRDKLFRSDANPWDDGFPILRDQSYLSDIKMIKIAFDIEDEDAIIVKVKLLNSKHTKISLKRLKTPRACPSLAEVVKGVLDFLGSTETAHSVEILRLEYCPLLPPEKYNVPELTRLLREFRRLETLVLWGYNPAYFLEGLIPPVASCHFLQKLVIYPAHTPESAELQVLKSVRDCAVSRKDCGVPLKAVSLYLREAETLSHSILVGELKSCVELVNVFRASSWRESSWVGGS